MCREAWLPTSLHGPTGDLATVLHHDLGGEHHEIDPPR